MKNVKLVLTMLLLMATMSVFAQNSAKVIAVINKAEWCGVCKANGGRVMADVLPNYKEPSVKIIVNDLTDDKTIVSSKESLEMTGIYKEVSMDKTTGIITFYNAKTKKIISKISVAKSSDDIKKAFDEAIMKASKS